MLVASGCGDDGSSGASSAKEDVDVQQLLGPQDRASGEPVRLGLVSDGATPAYDNTDEGRAAKATAEYWNEHRGGVGGRPIEVVVCDTGGDPAGATGCANELVEQGVVAVALNNSAVAESVWEPLHAAGIPMMLFQAFGDDLLADDASTFVIVSPLSTLFGLPFSVAESEGADRIAFVVLDVPQATGILREGAGAEILARSGIDSDVVPIALGTADMTAQMQQVVNDDPGVVHVLGNDAFCIAAFNGLVAAGYDGAITAVSQCITDATREGVAGDVLDGMYLTAGVALGATDDPTYQLYEAVVDTYGVDIRDAETTQSMGGYTAMAALATSLEGIQGDITPEAAAETIKDMPERELPGGGGVTFRCGGSALPAQPAVCSNEWLRTQLDANGQPTTYEAIDSTDLLNP
jgi:branched-chain amino acid transport system substrate-binding protein